MPCPSRRAFLTGLGAAAMGPLILAQRAFAQDLPARIDAAALRQRIEALSTFGRPPGGTFADGVSRVAYSDADVAGRRYLIDLMRTAGLEPRIDAAGNIFGRRTGIDGALPPILFGSHIDSVPNGGNFDGDLSIRVGTFRDPEIEDAPSLVGGAKTEVSNRYLWFHASSPVQDSFES